MKKTVLFRHIKKTAAICFAAAFVLLGTFNSFAYTIRGSQDTPTYGPGMTTYFNGEEMMILGSANGQQMMSYVITTKNGGVFVIDGGTEDDAEHLAQIIKSKGGRVNAWLITHPHNDHAGAFTRIVNEGAAMWGLDIQNVYYNITSQAFYDANEPDRAGFVNTFRTALANVGVRAHVVHRGEVIECDGVSVTVMNEPYLVTNNPINNSSVVYRMTIGDKIITFLGDIHSDVANMFLADHQGEDLTTYFVQMSHHGNYGADRNFYEVIKPKVCMWNAPAWLYDNWSGQYQTTQVRQWMKEMGVTANYSISSGDQIIR